MEHSNKETITIQMNKRILKLYQLLCYLRAAGVIAIIGMLWWKCFRQADTLRFIVERENMDAYAYSIASGITVWGISLILTMALVVITTIANVVIAKKYITKTSCNE